MKGWVIALLVGVPVAAVIVVAGIYEGKASAAAPVVPPAPQNLLPGHRYGFSAQCPFPFPALPPAGSTTAVAALLGVTGVSVYSYSPAADGKSFAVVFDYSGAAMVLPNIQVGGGTACTSELVDMELTPVGGTGGTVQPQSVTVYWSKTSSASKSRPAVVVAPSKIFSVDMGGTGTAVIGPDNVATLTFNGTPGTVMIYGSVTSQYAHALAATVLVS